jgi:hypothetical protein
VAATALVVAAACNNEGGEGNSADGSATGGIVTLEGSGTDGATGVDDDDGDKLDVQVGTGGDSAGDCNSGGGGMPGQTEFSLIWIANSPEGTVSKIDTESGTELGRYFTGPTNGDDDPSRTSVNLVGDVAVANRGGSLAKFAAREERCVDQNGDGVITTSTGPMDVLPFGEDECLLWHVPLPQTENTQGPRPTAWDAGTSNGACPNDDARVWNGWWVEAEGTAYFRRFDGQTGATLDDVVVPDYQPGQDWGYGPYGGAVDADGNFWVTGLHGPLLRIDAVTLDVQSWPVPADANPYGMGVDANGHPWMVGHDSGTITHFDPGTEMFTEYPTPNGSLRGMMIDRNGHLWAAGNDPCGLVQFDTGTRLLINANVPLPSCATPVGVSIDVDGFVWVPDQGASMAYKVDPITYTSTTTLGLVEPYTYSDMTGAGLGLVVNPPQG